MNWVWEQYLQSILEDEIKGKGYTFQPQDEKNIFIRNKNPLHTLKPDLCIYKDEKSALILDAKYKNAWSDAVQNKNGNFDERVREDYFQILAYMYGFRCNKAGIFCPCSASNSSHSEHEYYEYTITKDREKEKFYLLPLYIPHSQESKNNSFKSFKEVMEKTNEPKFKEQVKNILEIS